MVYSFAWKGSVDVGMSERVRLSYEVTMVRLEVNIQENIPSLERKMRWRVEMSLFEMDG